HHPSLALLSILSYFPTTLLLPSLAVHAHTYPPVKVDKSHYTNISCQDFWQQTASSVDAIYL
ncbi:hypothetical protein, partial [Nostoc sp. NMS8]|uniref:hypothetical protein n=1 Tax=Nostoc sp. NMS8 TaxID=2815392 RepID=UPI0025E10B08